MRKRYGSSKNTWTPPPPRHSSPHSTGLRPQASKKRNSFGRRSSPNLPLQTYQTSKTPPTQHHCHPRHKSLHLSSSQQLRSCRQRKPPAPTRSQTVFSNNVLRNSKTTSSSSRKRALKSDTFPRYSKNQRRWSFKSPGNRITQDRMRTDPLPSNAPSAKC